LCACGVWLCVCVCVRARVCVCVSVCPCARALTRLITGPNVDGIEGYLVTDELTMGGSSASVSIGAITTMRGTWQQAPANGIFGVGMAPLNCLVSTFGASAYERTCSPSAMTSFLEGNGLVRSTLLCSPLFRSIPPETTPRPPAVHDADARKDNVVC
jgi:hypothetical protein